MSLKCVNLSNFYSEVKKIRRLLRGSTWAAVSILMMCFEGKKQMFIWIGCKYVIVSIDGLVDILVLFYKKHYKSWIQQAVENTGPSSHFMDI